MTDTPLEQGPLKPARVRTTRRTMPPYADAVLFMALHKLFVLRRDNAKHAIMAEFAEPSDHRPWVMANLRGAPDLLGIHAWVDRFTMRDEILWKVTQHLNAMSPRHRMIWLSGRKPTEGEL